MVKQRYKNLPFYIFSISLDDFNTSTLKSRILRLYYKFKLRKLSIKLGFTIPTNVCGPGLSLPHYGTIIINPQAKIGSNCRLHACVNIGASAGSKLAPQIGDNVYIGPGAILFGNINITNNVTIGANATVNKDCSEEYCVLAGSPAKIVKTGMPNWLEFNKVSTINKKLYCNN